MHPIEYYNSEWFPRKGTSLLYFTQTVFQTKYTARPRVANPNWFLAQRKLRKDKTQTDSFDSCLMKKKLHE